MKKTFIIFFILFLILFTAIIKNSTKKIEEDIFTSEENLRRLNKEFENIKLEYEYLSSTEKLLEFQDKYFEDKLAKKDIQDIKVISIKDNEYLIKKLNFKNEK